jgi:aminopeptidase N
MDNFYTGTVYVKGAEVVRMYRTLLGEAGFKKGMVLYFERHDGGAVTCDDFRAAMADANKVDLSQFERWYNQAGDMNTCIYVFIYMYIYVGSSIYMYIRIFPYF